VSYPRSQEMDDWVAQARKADCLDVLGRLRQHQLKISRAQAVGPCPACGGTDRFSINRTKNIFHCRIGAAGGDAIAMVMYLDGVDFLRACEIINGSPPPRGPSGALVDREKIKRQEAEAKARAEKRAAEDNSFRNAEIARAHRIWSGAGAMPDSVAEAYLRFRGCAPAPGAKLRSYVKLPYWSQVAGSWQVIHEGPAMVAAIQGRDQGFIGCHITYIDGAFKTASGKAEIYHPETGEVLDAKKVRGSQKGGHIHLGGPENASRLIMGEGIETVYSVREKLRSSGLNDILFWSAVNLGNIGGAAVGRVFHPTLTRTDKNGRVSRLRVLTGVPNLSDTQVVWPPDTALQITLLGDGDSDRFNTRNTLQRGALRWARPGRVTKAAWAADGTDFNQMLREPMAA
jgi:hypothetical protein